MTDTHNFQPLEDYSNSKSPYFISDFEEPIKKGGSSPKLIHRQMTKKEAKIQKGRDRISNL